MPAKNLISHQRIGSAKLQRAQEMRSAMTPTEHKLWEHLRANRLGGFHFRRQQIIEPYIVDFYCHQAALVFEVDGDIHLGQQEYDGEREQDLQSMGLHVIRFSNAKVNENINHVLTEIYQMCQLASIKKQDQK